MASLHVEANGRLVVSFELSGAEAAELLASLEKYGIKPEPARPPDPPPAPPCLNGPTPA